MTIVFSYFCISLASSSITLYHVPSCRRKFRASIWYSLSSLLVVLSPKYNSVYFKRIWRKLSRFSISIFFALVMRNSIFESKYFVVIRVLKLWTSTFDTVVAILKALWRRFDVTKGKNLFKVYNYWRVRGIFDDLRSNQFDMCDKMWRKSPWTRLVPEKHIISQSLLVPLLPLFEFNDHCLGASSLEILKFSAFLDFSKSLTISRFDRQWLAHNFDALLIAPASSPSSISFIFPLDA